MPPHNQRRRPSIPQPKNTAGRGHTSQSNTGRPACPGHNALGCYHRMDFSYQGRHPPQQLAAMLAQANASSSPRTWYTDSGATNHIIANLGNLSLQSEYHGHDNVAVGNGTSLQLANTGSSTLITLFSNFKVSDILHCPTANLLSVHRFATDNNCHFIFTSNCFIVKDNITGRTLLQGPSENGLYPILLQHSISESRHLTTFLGVRASTSI